MKWGVKAVWCDLARFCRQGASYQRPLAAYAVHDENCGVAMAARGDAGTAAENITAEDSVQRGQNVSEGASVVGRSTLAKVCVREDTDAMPSAFS